MKKKTYILILILLLLFVGCTNGESIDNDSGNENIENKENQDDTSDIIGNIDLKKDEVDLNIKITSDATLPLSSFSFHTFKTLMSSKEYQNKNLFYSPASFYSALSMVAEGSDNDSYQELMSLLESSSLSELRSINSVLSKTNNYDNEEGKAKLANSLWINKAALIKETYVRSLLENYNASVFSEEMDEATLEKIAKWVNDNTFDFLKTKKEDFETLLGTTLSLINTLYFNNTWLVEFDSKYTTSKEFNNGEVIMVSMMDHSIKSKQYYKTKTYAYAVDSFNNGNKIHYVLPNDGYSLSDCMNDDLLATMNNNVTYEKVCQIHFNVPKFKYQNSLDLVSLSQTLGCDDIFDASLADLSKMSDEKLYIGSIKQIAGIELSEQGVEAAASTFIGVVTSAAPTSLVYVNFYLNKPFIYYITDAKNNILFMGACVNPSIQ